MNTNYSILTEKQMRLLSVSEASKILKLRKTVLSDLISKGLIRAITVGERVKIPYYSLENFVRNLPPVPKPVTNSSQSVSSAILEQLISKN